MKSNHTKWHNWLNRSMLYYFWTVTKEQFLAFSWHTPHHWCLLISKWLPPSNSCRVSIHIETKKTISYNKVSICRAYFFLTSSHCETLSDRVWCWLCAHATVRWTKCVTFMNCIALDTDVYSWYCSDYCFYQAFLMLYKCKLVSSYNNESVETLICWMMPENL